MDKQQTVERIQSLGLIAILRSPTPELCLKTAEALIAGGIQAMEVTYTTPQAAEVTRQLADRYDDQILLGMGTLTSPLQAAEATRVGARFLVSPICEPALGTAMISTGLVTMIGALTPTEIYQAYTLGSTFVKLFPGSLVGPGYVRALHGPLPQIPVIPTGGVSAANVGEWFAAGVAAVGAGSELCPASLAAAGQFDEITRRAEAFVAAVKAAKAEQAK